MPCRRMLVPGAVDGTLGHTYILWSDGFRPCFDFRTNQKPDSLSTDVLITIRSEINRPVLSAIYHNLLYLNDIIVLF